MMASVSANPLLKAARWYAKRNIFVFPLHNVEDDGSCSCRDAECKNQGKHPRTQHGFKDATIDLEKIGQWWTTFPKANIGIACEPTGWAVIDVDPRHGGDETLRDLEQQYGPLPDTVRQVTGSGGQHIVFTYPFGGAPTVAGIRPGIDTRARGGYIVGAPSAHVSGNAYAWEVAPGEMPLAELPHWFRDLLTTRTERQRTDEPGAVIPEGRRDETLASLAGSMRARGHTKEEIAAALLVTNRDRCVPPLDERDVRRIAWSISQYEAGKGAFAAQGDDKPPEEALIDWPAFWTTDQKAAEWLCEPLIPLGRQVSIYSRAKSGKSLLVLDICARLATGQKCLYQPAGEPMRVVYFDFEMTDLDLRERLEDMGYGPDSDLSNLFYYLLPSLPPMDTQAGGEAVMEIVRRHDPTLVVIDTTSRVISGKENDSDSFRAFYMYTGLQLKADGRTVVRLDHMGKAQELGQRGSSAKNDDVDLVWELTVQDGGAVKLTATHRRQGWVPEEVNLVRKDEPLRHALAANTWPAGTEALARTLDEIGAPLSGIRQVRDLLKENGRKAENKVLAAAMRYRRERPQSVTENTAEHVAGIADADSAEHSVTDSVTPPVTLRNSVTGSEEALRSLKKSVTLPNPAPERRKNADGLYVDEEGKPLL